MSGAESSKGHYGSTELDKLHHPAGGTTEGGACLTGHEASYKEHKKKVTCNYRYQAHEQAKSEARVKDRLESYKTKALPSKIGTSWYRTNKNERWPAEYCTDLPIPSAANLDWDVEGRKRGSAGPSGSAATPRASRRSRCRRDRTSPPTPGRTGTTLTT